MNTRVNMRDDLLAESCGWLLYTSCRWRGHYGRTACSNMR